MPYHAFSELNVYIARESGWWCIHCAARRHHRRRRRHRSSLTHLYIKSSLMGSCSRGFQKKKYTHTHTHPLHVSMYTLSKFNLITNFIVMPQTKSIPLSFTCIYIFKKYYQVCFGSLLVVCWFFYWIFVLSFSHLIFFFNKKFFNRKIM